MRLSHDDEEALLEVVDTGRGIAPAFLPQVFEMFRQADAATTRDEGGLGIGLALVKSLVELHGGRVAAESAGRGRGTTLRVWLPMHQRTGFGELDEAEEATPGRTIAGSRVLLVDDTLGMLETFGYLLEHEGARVTPASTGAEALALTENEDFDLVISDVGMPGMDGYQMIAEMRKRARPPAGDRLDRARTDAGRRARPAVGVQCTSASRSTSLACV